MKISLANHLKSLPDKELELLLVSLDPASLAKLSITAPVQTRGELKTVKKKFTDADFIQKIYTFLLLGLEIFKGTHTLPNP
jgi:hypothetical protein